LLHDAGYDVVLIARGEHLWAIQSDGLLLSTPLVQRRTRIEAVGSPSEIDWQADDVVLLTVKSQDTEPALRLLPGWVEGGCLQHGVANERAALCYCQDVFGVCVMFPATHLIPGVVNVHSTPVPGILNIGRYPSGVEGAGPIAKAFRDAGFACETLADIM